MSTIVRPALLIIIGLLLIAPEIEAQDDFEITYDLFIRDSCLTTWLNLAPLITSKSVQRLRDGVELVIECRAMLGVHRRFWGDRTVAGATKRVRLAYRDVTSDFLLTIGDSTEPSNRQLGSLASLHGHLKDSIEICIARIDQLDVNTPHFLSLHITAISLTDLNLDDDSRDRDDSESPVRFLFRQFLRLTDYGRREYSTRSGDFSVAELETIP